MSYRVETQRHRGRAIVAAFLALGLLCGGVLIGRGLAPNGRRSGTAITTVTSRVRTAIPTTDSQTGYQRTPTGAAAAAGTYVTALGGPAILEPARIRATLRQIATPNALPGLERAYAQAGAGVRSRFGMNGEPKPIVILRSAPLGYRIERFSPSLAGVAVWDVGIVGSGANVDPQASWRTEHVTLVWRGGTWKVAGFRSESGPTPPLAAGDVETPPTELFVSIPALKEYADVQP